jgi:hypothetical protein
VKSLYSISLITSSPEPVTVSPVVHPAANVSILKNTTRVTQIVSFFMAYLLLCVVSIYGEALLVKKALLLQFAYWDYVHTATTTASSGLPKSRKAMRW